MKHILLSSIAAVAFAGAAIGAPSAEPIFIAIASANVPQVEEMLKNDPSLATLTNRNGLLPLHVAARYNQAEAARKLIAAGADLEGRSTASEATALHFAANSGSVEMVRLLLQEGADPEARAVNGRTPLHFAAQRGQTEAVKALLEGGANPNSIDPLGETALHLAASANQPEVIRALLSGGADPDITDAQGAVPADFAETDAAARAFSEGAAPSVEEPAPVAIAPGLPIPALSAPAVPTTTVEDETPEATPEVAEKPETPAPAPLSIGGAAIFRDETIPLAERAQRFKADPATRAQTDGSFYNGEVSARGFFEGFGVLLMANGRERYEGGFHRGAKSGLGRYFYANGDVLECGFKNNAPEGTGTYTYANGDQITGTWHNGLLQEGRGIIVSETGARFQGLWSKGSLVSSTPIE